MHTTKTAIVLFLFSLSFVAFLTSTTNEHWDAGMSAYLPLPSRLSLKEYEKHLYNFLDERKYLDLSWIRDKI